MRLTATISLTALLTLSGSPATFAQLTAASEAPIAYGHHHLNVTDVEEHKRFWIDTLGGIAIQFGANSVAKFPNVHVFLREQAPTGGTKGTTVNHIGFEVDGLEAFSKKLEAQGIVFDRPYREIEGRGIAIAYFTDPFGTYIELTEGLDNL